MNGVKKANLPSKICPACKRPFSWRKSGIKIGIMSNTVAKDVETFRGLFNLV